MTQFLRDGIQFGSRRNRRS